MLSVMMSVTAIIPLRNKDQRAQITDVIRHGRHVRPSSHALHLRSNQQEAHRMEGIRPSNNGARPRVSDD